MCLTIYLTLCKLVSFLALNSELQKVIASMTHILGGSKVAAALNELPSKLYIHHWGGAEIMSNYLLKLLSFLALNSELQNVIVSMTYILGRSKVAAALNELPYFVHTSLGGGGMSLTSYNSSS